MAMFGYLKHILDGSNFEDDGEANGDEVVIDIGLIKTMYEGVHPMDEVGVFDKQRSSIVPLQGILVCLKHMMQKIVEGCTRGGVALCDHATLNHESCGIKNSKHLPHKGK
jgi:hypothetical protein